MSEIRDGVRAELLLRAAMDAMVDPQALLEAVRDGHGRVVDFVYREVNQAACTYLGSSREELTGTSLVETLSDFVGSGFFDLYVRCLETGEPMTADAVPYLSERQHGLRRFDVRGSRANPDWLSVVWRDVTDSYETQRDVAMSEEHFRLLLENSGDVVVQFRDQRVVWISPSVQEALGAPPDYCIGRPTTSVVASEDLPVFEKILAATVQGDTVTDRLRIFDANGGLHWIQVRAKLYYDVDGRPDGHTAALRVIDDEVAAEQSATQARQEQADADARFRRMMENSSVGMSLNTPDGRFVDVNQALCDMLGYDAATLCTKTWQDVTGPTTLEADIRQTNDLAAGIIDNYRTTKQFIHSDGHLVWAYLSAGCIRDANDELELFVAQFIDVTTEVELRAKEAEADARFRRLMETSNVAMALVGPDGKMEVVNQALCDLFGYDEQTIRTKTWQEMTPDSFLEADLKNTADLLAGRLDTYRVTKQHIHADGHLIWVDLSVSCLRDTDGNVQYLVAQGVDISEEVRAQELLAQQEWENRVLADRLQAEMLSAAKYVESILPGDLHGPVEVSSRYLPALDLGGDGYHYRWLDDDHLKIYLIDVSGHGMRPALFAISVHNLIRSGSFPMGTLLNPNRLLNKLNELFQMDDQGGAYFTIWYGVYQLSTRTLRYASAGHPPALGFVRDGDGTVDVTQLSTHGFPIGMFPDTVYSCDSYEMPNGGQLLLYSDGAFELPVASPEQKPMGLGDFIDVCVGLAARPDWSLDELVDRLQSLSPSGDFDDDCSLVLLTFP